MAGEWIGMVLLFGAIGALVLVCVWFDKSGRNQYINDERREGEKEMKRLVEEVDGEGLESLMGERVTLMCMNYFYTGKLVGVNDTCVKLTDAAVVFETGAYTNTEWKDAQSLPNDWYVQTATIESFGILK